MKRATFWVLALVLAVGVLGLAGDGSAGWRTAVDDEAVICAMCPQASPPTDWWCWYKWPCGPDLTWWYICCYGEYCEEFIILPVIGPICLKWQTSYVCGCFPPEAIPYSVGKMALIY